jgi:hypothetical protein
MPDFDSCYPTPLEQPIGLSLSGDINARTSSKVKVK